MNLPPMACELHETCLVLLQNSFVLFAYMFFMNGPSHKITVNSNGFSTLKQPFLDSNSKQLIYNVCIDFSDLVCYTYFSSSTHTDFADVVHSPDHILALGSATVLTITAHPDFFGSVNYFTFKCLCQL